MTYFSFFNTYNFILGSEAMESVLKLARQVSFFISILLQIPFYLKRVFLVFL